MDVDSWDEAAPPDFAALLDELGPPVAEFSVNRAQFLWQLLVAPLLFVVGLVLTILPIAAVFWMARGAAMLFKLFLVGVVLVAAAVVVAVRAVRNRGLRVLVFREGLVRLHGAKADAFFWEDVDGVWRSKGHGVLAHLSHGTLSFVVRRRNGQTFHFDDVLPELKKLGVLLHELTLPHLLPTAQQALEQGASVDFDKFRVTAAGVHQGKQFLPWDQVKEVKIDADKVAVHKAEGWFTTWLTAPVAEVRNLHLFRALAERRSVKVTVPAEKE